MSRHIALTTVVLVILASAASGAPGSNGQEDAPGQQPPESVTPPAINGSDSPKEGEWLTADAGAWDGKGLKYAYQWLHCDSDGANCTAVPDATGSTYLLARTDFGTRMRTLVAASNSKGTAVATSDATDVVDATTLTPTPTTTTETTTTETTTTSPSATPPSNTSLPTISGKAQQGETLSATPGSFSGTTPLAYASQWKRCDSSGASCATIAGATAAVYLVTSADIASTLRVSVTATNAAGSATASSQPTSVVTAPSPPPNPAPASTPLMHSGFEPGTTLDALPGSPPQNGLMYLHGLDSTTGFNWDTARFYGEPWWVTIAGIPSGLPGTTSDIVDARIESRTGPYGTQTNALRMGVKQQPQVAQVFLDTNFLQDTPVVDYYARYWARLDPDLAAKAAAAGNSYWRGFWTFKTPFDLRMKIEIMNWKAGGPSWVATMDNLGHSASPPAIEYWRQDSDQIKVPLDQWFYVEIYLHRSTGSDGRFYFGVNGQKVFDRLGPNYGPNREEIKIIAHNLIYGGANAFPGWQWVDDFEARNLPPCAGLPCGPPPRLS